MVMIAGWLIGCCHKCSHCMHTCMPVGTVYTHCTVIYIHTGRMLHIQYDTSLLQDVKGSFKQVTYAAFGFCTTSSR